MNIPLSVGIMLFCIIMSAYFSATETAFSSLSKTKLKLMAETDKRALKTLNVAENYDKLISTILIGNNIVNIALASIGTLVFVHLLGDSGATVSTIVVTIVVLIFGEIGPKSIAKDIPEKFAMFSTPLISFLMVILTPFTILFSSLKKLIAKMMNIESDNVVSSEELIMIVDEAAQEGGIDEDESELLHNAIQFSDLKAEDILTHRVDIEAVAIDEDKLEIAKVFNETKFSRLPVYEESIDKIVGIIHLKDFFGENGIISGSIKDIMTTPVFVLPSERIDDLLRLLQKNKSHVAVVLDEYGGTFGIVTMEDILEELVGDIWDEHDEVVEDLKKISDDEYIVNCAMPVDDFCKEFEMDIESENVSLGGWISEIMGKIPEEKDFVEYENLLITIEEVDNHRIEKARIKVNERTDESETQSE